MRQALVVFDESWLASAQEQSSLAPDFWVQDVMKFWTTTGSIYLDTLRQWFDGFPLSLAKQKNQLKRRLESFTNDTHLGAVNELAWWAFMQHLGLRASPVPESTKPRPDFHVQAPATFFVEVSTVNPSMSDKSQLETGEGVALDHPATLRRFLGKKVTEEKKPQMAYAASEQQPCVLVLFDYTTWSAFGTQFFDFLANALLGREQGFHGLPRELSALVYVERKVMNGRSAVSLDRSAIYYNPRATYPLDNEIFALLKQFGSQAVAAASQSADHWLWL